RSRSVAPPKRSPPLRPRSGCGRANGDRLDDRFSGPLLGLGTSGAVSRRMAMTDAQTVIYPPPRSGLPYLVVTVLEGTVSAVPAASELEARSMATKRVLRSRRAEVPEQRRTVAKPARH